MPGGTHLRFLTLKETGGSRDYGIALLDMSSRAITTVIDLPGSAQHSSAVSPDGRWMAYASNETGRYEVWLEPLPGTGMRYRITKDGGHTRSGGRTAVPCISIVTIRCSRSRST